MGKPYVVHHLELDGEIIDRDQGLLSVHFSLEPLGTELPEGERANRLVIRIGPTNTAIDQEAIEDLTAWLENHGQEGRK